MGNIDAKRLLELSSGLGALTLVTTYLVSTTSGRVAPFIPIISEMPFAEPESSLFSAGLTVSIFCFILLTQTFHRIFGPMAREAGGNYESWNDLIRIMASFGGVCGIITVNFHWNIHPVLHGVTAGVLFTSFLIWGTFANHLLEKSGKGHDIRRLAVYAGWGFYALMIVFSGFGRREPAADQYILPDCMRGNRKWDVLVKVHKVYSGKRYIPLPDQSLFRRHQTQCKN